MTIRELYNYVYESLLIVEEEREAKVLTYRALEFFTGYDRLKISLSPNTLITQAQFRQLKSVVVALQAYTPIQYITGEAYFCGLTFHVNQHVLIPRPETEELVYWILDENPDFSGSILDIGCGSGCIAISLAVHNPQAKVIALDISENTLQLARSNANFHNAKVHFVQKDILSPDFYDNTLNYDIIVSNPPYVRHAEKKYMSKKVLDYEPASALYVPDDNPLLYYQSIVKWASIYLQEKGILYFEINEACFDEMKQLLIDYRFCNITLKKDLHGKCRMLKAKRN